MTVFRKAFAAQVKAAEREGATGVIEAIVAAYNVDSVGDKIVPGAFSKTLEEWGGSGRQIPVIFAHQSHDPDMYLGGVVDASEISEGLRVKAQLDLDHPKAARTFELLEKGLINNFSFAYEVMDGAFVDKSEEYGPHYELRELKLFEVGPCLVGANQETRLLGAKRAEFVPEEITASTDAKAGRALSKKNEELLRSAAENLAQVLSALDGGGDSDEGKAETASGKAEASEATRILAEVTAIEIDID